MTKSLVVRDPIIDRLVVAREALSKAVTLVPVKQLHSMAAAAEVYARQQGLSEESIGFAHQVKIEALARLGEIMDATPKAKGTDRGGRPKIDGSRKVPSISPPTLAEQGVDKKTAHLARRLAALPGVDLNAVAARDKTLAAVTREKTAAVREQRISLPDAKYRVVLADPPWDYNDKADAGAVQGKGAEHHYPAMSIDELCALDVKSICDQDAVLFLWVTSPLLFECQPVVGAWGFTYRASFVWDKVKHNMGHYNSVRHEFLLICGRGACAPVAPTLYDSVQVIERTEHSAKPEAFRDIIDDLYPSGKRIELFARRDVDGWDRYGNELLRDEAR